MSSRLPVQCRIPPLKLHSRDTLRIDSRSIATLSRIMKIYTNFWVEVLSQTSEHLRIHFIGRSNKQIVYMINGHYCRNPGLEFTRNLSGMF